MEPASHSTITRVALAKRGTVCRKWAPRAGDEDEPEDMCNRDSQVPGMNYSDQCTSLHSLLCVHVASCMWATIYRVVHKQGLGPARWLAQWAKVLATKLDTLSSVFRTCMVGGKK